MNINLANKHDFIPDTERNIQLFMYIMFILKF